MAEKFQNKYRMQSNRMPKWDYSGNGVYFITIVTQNRVCNFGHINNGKMIFSEFGKIINDEWLKSFEIRNELFLDEYIIMPNHLHAIVVLDNTQTTNNGSHDRNVGLHGRVNLHYPNYPFQQPVEQPKFIRKPKSISSFIAGFKSVINTKIDDYIDEHNLNIPKYNRKNHFFQSNYYDHIIRNESEYHRIKEYIINNPIKWENNKLNSTNKTTKS